MPGILSRQDERGLDLVGFMAFLDPPKESAAEVIRALHRHGVQVKILTGDHDIIARQVCNQVGIESQLFARLNPQRQVRVIEVRYAQGQVVGFLGAGIPVTWRWSRPPSSGCCAVMGIPEVGKQQRPKLARSVLTVGVAMWVQRRLIVLLRRAG